MNSNTSLSRIQELTRKLRTINPPKGSSKTLGPNTYNLRVDQQYKLWKDRTKTNDMAVSQATAKVNELIDTMSDGIEGDNRIMNLRTKVIRGLEEIELHKSITNPAMLSLKTSLDPLESKGVKMPIQSFRELELVESIPINDKLAILSKESSKISKMIMETIQVEFGKLEGRLEQEMYQQEQRDRELHQCIDALEKEIELAIDCEQKQLNVDFQDHHRYLQEIIETLTLKIEE